MIVSTLPANGQGDSILSERENLRYGPSFYDEENNLILYSDLNKDGAKIKINSLSDLLKAWENLSGNSRKERYIAAVAISEHLKKYDIPINYSLEVAIQDPKSERHIDLVKYLSSKLEIIWEVSNKE